MSFKKHIAAKVWKSFTGKKTKGYMATDPHERKGIAQALKDMKKKGFIGKKSKNIPHDLTHLKGTLKD